MYQARQLAELLGARLRGRGGRDGRIWVTRNVLFLGLTSLVTDVSSEMVAAILPLYIVYGLELSPLALGAVDGLYQAAPTLVRVVTGFVGDRHRRLKEVAAFGYALSAVCKLGLIAAGSSVPLLAGAIALDRTGKGIRTAPRDALVSLSAPAEGLAAAFGVHRALDTVGAMLGPIAAFALLALVPGRFDVVFVVSFCVAVIGVAIFGLFVRAPAPSSASPPPVRATVRAALRLFLVPRFRGLVLVGSLLSAATLSDGLVYLVLKNRTHLEATYIPLLYVGSAGAYALLAVPFGRLADRAGRRSIFLGGYALLGALYGILLLGSGWAAIVGCVVLLGAWYAATDGVLMALATPLVPEELRATGLALVTTCTGAARLVSSLVFGALWSIWGPDRAVLVFLGALAVTALGAALFTAYGGEAATDAG